MNLFITIFLSILSNLTEPGVGNEYLSKPPRYHADTFNLSKYKGKVVVLNFWASWSKASRAENKNLVRIFQKHKINTKIVFASISLDTDEASWNTGIDEDEMEWKNHFCDFKKYDSPMAKGYKVNTLPVIIVFDKTGKIVKTGARVQDLEADIEALLNQ